MIRVGETGIGTDDMMDVAASPDPEPTSIAEDVNKPDACGVAMRVVTMAEAVDRVSDARGDKVRVTGPEPEPEPTSAVDELTAVVGISSLAATILEVSAEFISVGETGVGTEDKIGDVTSPEPNPEPMSEVDELTGVLSVSSPMPAVVLSAVSVDEAGDGDALSPEPDPESNPGTDELVKTGDDEPATKGGVIVSEAVIIGINVSAELEDGICIPDSPEPISRALEMIDGVTGVGETGVGTEEETTVDLSPEPDPEPKSAGCVILIGKEETVAVETGCIVEDASSLLLLRTSVEIVDTTRVGKGTVLSAFPLPLPEPSARDIDDT